MVQMGRFFVYSTFHLFLLFLVVVFLLPRVRVEWRQGGRHGTANEVGRVKLFSLFEWVCPAFPLFDHTCGWYVPSVVEVQEVLTGVSINGMNPRIKAVRERITTVSKGRGD